MLSTLAMGTLHQQMHGAAVNSKELFFLSTAIKNLASAEKTAVDRELMLRKQIAADLAKTVAPTLEKLDAGGLSADTAAAIPNMIAEVEA